MAQNNIENLMKIARKPGDVKVDKIHPCVRQVVKMLDESDKRIRVSAPPSSTMMTRDGKIDPNMPRAAAPVVLKKKDLKEKLKDIELVWVKRDDDEQRCGICSKWLVLGMQYANLNIKDYGCPVATRKVCSECIESLKKSL